MAIKKILLNLLGEKRYLTLLSGTYQRLYRTGLLGKEYEDVYFLKKIIRPGDYCADIGAHLGYFTIELSRLAGDSGKVFAVEPITPFHQILQRLLERKEARNVTLYQTGAWRHWRLCRNGHPPGGHRTQVCACPDKREQ